MTRCFGLWMMMVRGSPLAQVDLVDRYRADPSSPRRVRTRGAAMTHHPGGQRPSTRARDPLPLPWAAAAIERGAHATASEALIRLAAGSPGAAVDISCEEPPRGDIGSAAPAPVSESAPRITPSQKLGSSGEEPARRRDQPDATTPGRLCDWNGGHRCSSPAEMALVYVGRPSRLLCSRHASAVLEWYRAGGATSPPTMVPLAPKSDVQAHGRDPDT